MSLNPGSLVAELSPVSPGTPSAIPPSLVPTESFESPFAAFTPGTNFRAWFLKILMNSYYSRRRREKSRPVTSDLDDTPDLYVYARSGEAGFPTQGPDPAAQLLDTLGTERIV